MSLTFMVAGVACPPLALGAQAAIGDRFFLTAAGKAARFPRAVRLLRHADFERVYKAGRRQFSGLMTVFYLPRSEQASSAQKTPASRASASRPQGPRVGFAVGRVLGGAVQRNRIKRRLREAVRLSLPMFSPCADVVIHPKKLLLTADFAAILSEVQRAFAKIERELSNSSKSSGEASVTGERD